MKNLIHILFIALLLPASLITGCKQPADVPAPDDQRIKDRRYCNDPLAVNYNWDFPGIPDNSTCFFASDVFTGKYLYIDSAYNLENEYLSSDTFLFTLAPLSTTRLVSIGLFCPGDSLFFTADKFATAVTDSLDGIGQGLLCGSRDTATASFAGSFYDSLRNNLKINATFFNQGRSTYHRGTAVKQ